MATDVPLTFGRADDFVVVSKPRKGIAFVEARFKEGFTHTHKGCRQILAVLERELSPEKISNDTLITLNADLLDDPIRRLDKFIWGSLTDQTSVYRDVPLDMFQSLRVVEFQGLDPSVRNVSARDVAIKVNVYGFNTDFSTDLGANAEHDMIAVLPSSKLDGIWELYDTHESPSEYRD